MNNNLTIYYCDSCAKSYNNVYKGNVKNAEFARGYIGGWEHGLTKCPFCGSPVVDTNLPDQDFTILRDVSNYNRKFLEEMIKLHNENIIEYELKMSQFRANNLQTQQIQQPEASKPKCPKCGSTNITTGQRGFSLLTGFWGSNKTVNRCANCGHMWKP